MSLVSNKYYNLKCDRCGSLLLEEIWYDKCTVEEMANDQDWITHKRKHYCPDCWTIDDEDNIVIKPSKDEN